MGKIAKVNWHNLFRRNDGDERVWDRRFRRSFVGRVLDLLD